MIEGKKYKWDDGYVFLKSKASWKKICQLWAEGGVIRYAGLCTSGPDAIVVFVDVEKDEPDGKTKLKDKMKRVEEKANPSFSSATATKVGTNGPTRWSVKKPFGAHLRFKTKDADAVFKSLYPGGRYVAPENYYGHAQCDGHWQVLLELGAETPEELAVAVAAAKRATGDDLPDVTTLNNSITEPDGPTADCTDATN